MDDEVGGVAPISDEQIEKLELNFGYSDDDFESLASAFRNAWPSIICRLRAQAAEIAELRQQLELCSRPHEVEAMLERKNVHIVELEAELADAKREAASVKEWAERAASNYRVQHAEMSATIDTLRADLERARAERDQLQLWADANERDDS